MERGEVYKMRENLLRDRLIELIYDAKFGENGIASTDCLEKGTIEIIADYLLANGVIVPPCKVGDTLWVLWSLTKAQKKEVYPVEAYALRYDDKKNNMRVCVEGRFKIEKYDGYYTHFYRGTFPWESVGKTIFHTREAAERALKGGAE